VLSGDYSSGGGYGNMNTAPTITITTLNISVQEKQTSAFTLTATDSNGDSLPFSGSGDDSSLMSIADAGVVTFNAALDFEVPSNANASNVSMIVAAESDGSLSHSKKFQVTVTNDTSDNEVASAWNGNLAKDNTYAPYDIHATSYALMLAGLLDVTDEFVKIQRSAAMQCKIVTNPNFL
jgi:hypothetical protein